MMKTLLWILLILILLGAAWYIWDYYQKQSAMVTPTPMVTVEPSIAPISETDSDTTTDLQAGGNSYSDPDGTFVFLYPNDYAQDSQDGDKIIRIYKRGATQQGQTEMYDGVIMVFEKVDLEGQTLEEWVDARVEELTADGTIEIIEQKTATTVNGYPAYTFTAQGLGESTYLVIQKDASSDTALMITYSVMDPENVGYQAEVDAVVGTVEML